MNDKARQYKVGLFVVSGIALLIAALLAFGIRGRFEPEYHFETYVEGDAEGLAVGSAVKLRGVDVGRVTGLDFSWNKYPPGDPNCIVISFDVRQRIAPSKSGKGEGLSGDIERGMRAIVKSNGITGTSVLSLEFMDPKAYPPLSFPWSAKSTYVPSAPSQFGQIIDAATNIATNLQKVDFAGIEHRVDHLLDTIDSQVASLDLASLGHGGGALIGDLRSSIQDIDHLARDTRGKIDGLQLNELLSQVGDAVGDLRGNSSQLQLTLSQLSQLDLRAINDTFAQSGTALRQISEAVDQLKREPSAFLFGEPPLPVSALDKRKP